MLPGKGPVASAVKFAILNVLRRFSTFSLSVPRADSTSTDRFQEQNSASLPLQRVVISIVDRYSRVDHDALKKRSNQPFLVMNAFSLIQHALTFAISLSKIKEGTVTVIFDSNFDK